MNFMKYKTLWFTISGLLILPGIIALSIWGLRVGIDFRGGTLIEVQFTQPEKAQVEAVKEALIDQQLSDLLVQTSGQGSILIRTEPVGEEKHSQIRQQLSDRVGEHTEIRFEQVGPTISKELTKDAVFAVIIASIAIIFFIAWSFRGLPKPASSWRFGISAVIALLHDLLFVVGAFSILGHFFGYEVDTLFITALLTVMGFSVHDTIVVFDRIRENLKRHGNQSFTEIANFSLEQTLARSLSTSLTVIFVLLALFLLGGESIKAFVLALLLGITIGTYSSIFNATPLLVVWHEAAQRRKNHR